MPRQEITVDNFSAGIVSGADALDTPVNSATWSVDQDPEVPQGILRGREEDEAYIDTTDDHNASYFSWIVREDGKRDFVYYSKTSGKISTIKDWVTAKTFANQATLTASLTVGMQTFNRAVRLGYGNNASKFIGYIDHGQFGGAAPGFSYVNAELENPTSFPAVYKAVGLNSLYSWAIQWQGKKVYKITLSSGAFTLSSKTFISLQGICEDGTYVYVYDSGIGTYGIIYKLLATTLAVVTSYPLSGFGSSGTVFGGSQAGIVTDIELNANNAAIFFAGIPGTSLPVVNPWNQTGSKFLFSQSLSGLTDGQAITPTDRTPSMTSTAAEGKFNGTGSVLPLARGLIKLSYSSEIGLLCSVEQNVYYNGIASNGMPYMSLIIFNTSFTAGGGFNTANSRLINFDGIGGITPSVGTPGTWSMLNAVYAFGSGADMMLVSQYSNVVSVNCTSDGVTTFKNITLGADGADFAWDATGWQTFPTVSDTEILGDGLIYASVMFSTFDVNFETFFFPARAYDVDPFGQNTDSTPRMYKMLFDTSFLYSAPLSYVKRSDVSIDVAESTDAAGTLQSKTYFYKLVPIYDGYQYAHLENFDDPEILVVGGTATASKVTVRIKASVLSARVTDVAIFRAEAVSATALKPTSLYRLVDTISIKDAWTLNSESSFGDFYEDSIYDTGQYGVSYESETGVPETLSNNYINYSISAQGNGYLFAGQCYNEELDTNSALNIIFRSKRNAPDAFDWTNDLLALPFRPLAMHFFRNQLLVFDQNAMAVVDPETFSLVAIFDGYGATDPMQIVSNNEIMVFANDNNIYAYDGRSVSVISHAINTQQYSSLDSVSTYTHRSLMAASYSLSIAFYGKKNSIAFCYTKASTTTRFFVYHMPTKSWHYWESSLQGTNLRTAGTGVKVVFSDHLGNIYVSAQSGVARIATSATRKACTWFSKQFTGGDNTVLTKFLKIIFKVPYGSTTTTARKYALNSNTAFTSFTAGSYLSDSTTKATNICIEIVCSATQELNGFTLIFRKMFGIR